MPTFRHRGFDRCKDTGATCTMGNGRPRLNFENCLRRSWKTLGLAWYTRRAHRLQNGSQRSSTSLRGWYGSSLECRGYNASMPSDTRHWSSDGYINTTSGRDRRSKIRDRSIHRCRQHIAPTYCLLRDGPLQSHSAGSNRRRTAGCRSILKLLPLPLSIDPNTSFFALGCTFPL